MYIVGTFDTGGVRSPLEGMDRCLFLHLALWLCTFIASFINIPPIPIELGILLYELSESALWHSGSLMEGGSGFIPFHYQY